MDLICEFFLLKYPGILVQPPVGWPRNIQKTISHYFQCTGKLQSFIHTCRTDRWTGWDGLGENDFGYQPNQCTSEKIVEHVNKN